jgi:hypothetical protein
MIVASVFYGISIVVVGDPVALDRLSAAHYLRISNATLL